MKVLDSVVDCCFFDTCSEVFRGLKEVIVTMSSSEPANILSRRAGHTASASIKVLVFLCFDQTCAREENSDGLCTYHYYCFCHHFAPISGPIGGAMQVQASLGAGSRYGSCR